MRMGRILMCCMVVISISSAAAVGEFSTYHGSLSTDQGGLQGTGHWVTAGVSTIQWWVTDYGDYWHYKYTLTVPQTEISHFIIEVSPQFGQHVDDYFNVVGSYGAIQLDTFTTANGNFDIPQPLWGMKFDETSGLSLTIEFDSVRQPVWGDFYAKAGGKVPHQIWNSGFADTDPTSPISNGSLNNHLIVPDSTIVPEPTTMALVVMGLAALVARRKSVKTL